MYRRSSLTPGLEEVAIAIAVDEVTPCVPEAATPKSRYSYSEAAELPQASGG